MAGNYGDGGLAGTNQKGPSQIAFNLDRIIFSYKRTVEDEIHLLKLFALGS